MSPRTPWPTCFYVLPLCGLWLVASGCSHLVVGSAFPLFSAQTQEDSTAAAAESCVVELRGELGRPRQVPVVLQGEMRVQDVLDASRAKSKFRKMNVVILRPLTPRDPNASLKLACRLDEATRKVTWDTDYAVLPGDRVLVTEDSSSVVDDVVTSLLGPIFGKVR